MSDTPTQGTVYTYARVSKSDEKTGSCSIAWQHGQIDDWLRRNGVTQSFARVDNGVSAAIPLDERPAGSDMVALAVTPGDTIVVAKFDRIFRSVEDFRARLRTWCQQGVRLVCVAEGLDLTTATGRMIATMVVAVSEWERETIGDRTRAALEHRRAHGLRSSTQARFGWRHQEFGEPRADGTRDARVVPDVAEQRTIALIEQLWGQCMSLREIARELTRQRRPTRHGRAWNASTISDILREIHLHRAPLTEADSADEQLIVPPPPPPPDTRDTL